MPGTTEAGRHSPPSRLRRVLWFAALYFAGLAAVALTAWVLRAVLGAVIGA